MGLMLNEKVINNMDELLKKESTSRLFKDSFSEIKFQKSSRGQYFITIVISLVLGVIIGFNKNTIPSMKEAITLILGADLAFIAMVFGAYSIFQALLTDSVIIALIKTDNNLLKISNKSFLNLVILYLVAIVTNLFLALIGTVMPDNYVLLSSLAFNNILASFFCAIYFSFNFLIILEIKNFGLNLYRMFNSYNSQRVIDILEEKIHQ